MNRFGRSRGMSVGVGQQFPNGSGQRAPGAYPGGFYRGTSNERAEFNLYGTPCDQYPNVAAAAMQCIPQEDGSMVCPPGYGVGGGPGGGPGGGQWGPWGLCGLYPQARGAVATALGIPPTSIPAAVGLVSGTATITVSPPNTCQIRCLDIPSDIAAQLTLESMTIGGRPMTYGSIPLRLFDQDSRASSKCFTSDTLGPGSASLIMVISNQAAQPVMLRGAFGIVELRC